MGAEFAQLRAVLDTNVVLSALLFPRGYVAWLRPLWTASWILPLACTETARELVRVLAYPKFRLTEDGIRAVLAAYLPFTETVTLAGGSPLKKCRDPHDQAFLELAFVGRAEVLVTGDDALLEMAGQVPFTIEAPAEFKKRFA